MRAGATALAVLAVGSLPWLIPSLLRPVYADPAGVAAFAARADTPFGSLGSLLMLGGMWNAQAVPAGYGGWWSVFWLALVLAAGAGYVAFGVRRHRWPGLGVAAVAGLVIASLGVTAPGRDLLRALGSLWPGFAVLRDGQQFIAPLALAEALGAGLLASWAARPGCPPPSVTTAPPPTPAAPPRANAGVPPTGPGWPSRWRWCSRRCCCCPGSPGGRRGGCVPSGTRRSG